MTSSPPEGFVPHDRKSAVTDPWEPLFARRDADGVSLGCVIGPQHCNGRGFLHGGVIAALADNAMGLTYVAAQPEARGALTVSLSLDYAGVGQQGQWLEIVPRLIKAGRTIGFVDALVRADGAVIARASATFKAVP